MFDFLAEIDPCHLPDRSVGNAGAKDVTRAGAHSELAADVGIGDDDIAAEIAADKPAGADPRILNVVGQLDPADRAERRIEHIAILLKRVEQCRRGSLVWIDKTRIALIVLGFSDEVVIGHFQYGAIPAHHCFQLAGFLRAERRRRWIDRTGRRNGFEPRHALHTRAVRQYVLNLVAQQPQVISIVVGHRSAPGWGLSFPKIISERIDDVIRPILGRRQWLQIAGRLDAKAHLSVMPGAGALDCNRPHRRKVSAADAPRQRSASDPDTRDARCRSDVPQCHFATAIQARSAGRGSHSFDPGRKDMPVGTVVVAYQISRD